MALGVKDNKGGRKDEAPAKPAVAPKKLELVKVPSILVKTFGKEYGFKEQMTEADLQQAMDMIGEDQTRLGNDGFAKQFAAEAELLKTKIQENGLAGPDGKLPKAVSRTIKNMDAAIDTALDETAAADGNKVTEQERIATKQMMAYAMIKEATKPAEPAHAKAPKAAAKGDMDKAMKAVDAGHHKGKPPVHAAQANEEEYDVQPPAALPKGRAPAPEGEAPQGGRSAPATRR